MGRRAVFNCSERTKISSEIEKLIKMKVLSFQAKRKWGNFFSVCDSNSDHGMAGINTDTVSFWHLWIYCARQLFLKPFRGVYVCVCVCVYVQFEDNLWFSIVDRWHSGNGVNFPPFLSLSHLIEGDKWKLQRIPQKKNNKNEKINGFVHSFSPFHRHKDSNLLVSSLLSCTTRKENFDRKVDTCGLKEGNKIEIKTFIISLKSNYWKTNHTN